jgi:hypothetical protein
MLAIDPNLLQKTWIHSREEDTADGTVYRTDQFRFPPSRGRRGFDLKEDGRLAQLDFGTADVPAASEGQWTLREDGCLVLHGSSPAEPKKVLKVVSLDQDKLVVKQMPSG